MKKFAVTFYYHTNCVVEVEAEDEKEALDLACEQVDMGVFNEQLMDGLQEDSCPDIEEI